MLTRHPASRRADRIPEPPIRGAVDGVSSIHLANVLTHRLGSLVSGIAGFTELLLERLGDSEQRELAMRIMESALRIEHVLADLTHYTRPISPEIEPMPVRTLFDDVLRVLSDEVAERIVVDAGDLGARHVVADPYLARDVLTYLLLNAIEATPGKEPVTLRASPGVPASVLWLEVENPASLEPAIAGRMFEPFFTTKARNLGVGLPLARRYARMQLGDVTLVANGLDGRVVLRFSLPASRLDPESTP
jgi:signal transduction histidine kinase